METNIKELQLQLDWYRERVVWGFYEEETPQFYQGKEGEHEICDPVTAKQVNTLCEENARMRKALEEIRNHSDAMHQRIQAIAEEALSEHS